jgi:hypothetical protein
LTPTLTSFIFIVNKIVDNNVGSPGINIIDQSIPGVGNIQQHRAPATGAVDEMGLQER